MDKLSIVVPCYNEEESLPAFYKEVTRCLQEIEGTTYEIIFIDDGSNDHTLQLLKIYAEQDEHVIYTAFSRNFGKEAAMFSGLESASGDYVTIMDADLQHPPKLLKDMYHAVSKEGYDCCGGKRETRDEGSGLRNFLSTTFYKVMQKMSKLDMSDGAGDYRMMNRTMVDALLQLKEYNRYMKGLYSYVGFETKWIPFNNVERVAGESKWSFKSLFSYAMQGMLSFSAAPLTIAGVFGVIFMIIGFIMLIAILLTSLIKGEGVTGWLMIVNVIILFSGIQLFFVSVLGQYVAKNYMEDKKRPIYIVKDTNKRITK